MIRIIGGKYRHLIIDTPKGNDITRPTTDKVREALMSSLGSYLNEAVVLDLFAGSGALGLEALSRGAKKAIFNDTSKEAITVIKNNIQKLKIEEEYELHQSSYLDFLKKWDKEKFDIVFLDPPYRMKEVYDEVVDYLFEHDLLSPHAIVVKECDLDFKEDNRFKRFKNYKYGIIHLSVYWR